MHPPNDRGQPKAEPAGAEPWPSLLLALTAPVALAPVGLLAWLVTLLIGVWVADRVPIFGLLLMGVAWALPTLCRLLSLAVQGRWVLLVGVLSVPVGVLGGLGAMVTMVLWDSGLLSGPPPTDRAFRSMTLGYLAMAAPVTLGQVAIESLWAGVATRWRSGAGCTAASMGLAWLLSSTLVVAGFAWDVQASAAWAPWLACDLGIGVALLGSVPGATLGRALARLFGREDGQSWRAGPTDGR